MKISAKARYALYAVVELAKQANCNQYVSVSVLAKNTGVTEKYLEQILAILKKDGIVQSTRGITGGYILADKAENITIGTLLRSVEDNLEMVKCLGGHCKDSCHCVSHNLWVKLYDNINNYLDTISLQQLLEDKL